MTKEEFKQTLESFFVSKFGIKFGSILPNNFNKLLESTISQSIAEHEDSQWKKYPEEKPDNQHYLCCADDGRQFVLYHDPKHGFGLMRSGGKYLNIIAFRELPEPYQEGGEK